MQRNRSITSSHSVLLLTAILVGSFVRLAHPVSGEYPLNDGGLFYTMVQDLQTSTKLLPLYTSYNQNQIPFAYPPLTFFLTQLIFKLTSIPLMELVRLMPSIISCLTIPAFYLLARRMLRSTEQILLATFSFALLPTAFDPLIVGGGLTRAPGLFFALLILAEIQLLCSEVNKTRLALTIIFGSLTVLSHPGMAWFTVYSAVLLIILHPTKDKRKYISAFLVAIGVFLLTAPWWVTLLSRYGVTTLLSPYQTESFSISTLLTPFSFLFTNEPLVDFLAVFTFLGLLTNLRLRNWQLPAWLLGVFIFEPRLGAAYSATPVALLAGVGIEAVLNFVEKDEKTKSNNQLIKAMALGFLLIYSLISAYLAPQYRRLSQAQVESMEWIHKNTSEDAQFLVLTGYDHYGNDYTNEWFPTLTHRHSLVTPQGYEWMPDQEFNRRASLHAELQSLAGENIANLETWVEDENLAFTHIYIARKALRKQQIPLKTLEDTINFSSSYEILFENEDAVILSLK